LFFDVCGLNIQISRVDLIQLPVIPRKREQDMNKLQELKLANTLRSIERYLTLYFEGGRHSAGDHVCD
jgi:hypothetical protein